MNSPKQIEELKRTGIMDHMLDEVDVVSKSMNDLEKTSQRASTPKRPRAITLGAVDTCKQTNIAQQGLGDSNAIFQKVQWPKYYPRFHSESFCGSNPIPSNILHYTTDTEDGEENGELPKGKTFIKKAFQSWKSEPAASWIILFVCLCPSFMLTGIEFAGFSLYYVEYAQYFHQSTSFAIGLIVALQLALRYLFSVVSGVLITRFGCRIAAMSGGIVISVSLLVSSFAPNVTMLYFTQGIFLGIGHSLTYMANQILVQQLFTKNRALGGGIGMTAVTCGNLVGIPLINFLITRYGWRGALLIEAAVMANMIPFNAMVTLPGVFKIHNKARKIEQKEGEHQDTDQVGKKNANFGTNLKIFLKDIFDFSLFKNPIFLCITLAGALEIFNIFVFVPHMPSRAVWLGMTRDDGALFMSVFSFGVLVTRIIVTFFANLRGVSRVIVYSAGCFGGGVVSFIIALWSTYSGQLTGAVFNGVHIAMTNTIVNVMLVDLIGIELLPKALALFNLVGAVSTFTAPPLAGLIYDVTNNYNIPFIVSGIVGIVSSLLGTVTTVLHRKQMK